MLEPGTILNDRYRVVDTLGEGGMGVVYRGEHVALGHPVALKALREDALADDEIRARFLREARIASSLSSPHVARVFDVGTLPSGAPFIVMEFLEGSDLDAELGRRGALPIGEAVELVRQACEAMVEAHAAGIVHRDLKPANLFLATQGSRKVVKVLDFGISLVASPEDTRLTRTQAAFGTPLYMSPEAILSTKHADARSDVWALGIILYELLAGRTPFVGETATAIAVKINVEPPAPLRDLRPDVPPELEAVILRTLTKDRDARMPSARALAEALAPFSFDASGSQTLQTGAIPRSRSSSVIEPHGADATAPTIQFTVGSETTAPRSRVPLFAGGLGLVALLGVGSWLAFGRSESRAPAASSASTESAPLRAEVDAARSHAMPTPTTSAATQAPPEGSTAAPSPPPTVTTARPKTTSAAATTSETAAKTPTPAGPPASARAPVPPVAAPKTTPSPGGAPLGI